MELLKLVSIGIALLFIQACSHPIEIVGEGDVTSTPGNRSCLLEDYTAGQDNCTKNYVLGAYNETYTATPRVGWLFDRWGNYCAASTTNQCAFSIPAAAVQQFWGQSVPPLQAVFAKYKLTGPILPESGISLAPLWASQVGYQKQEFFLAGTAHSYTLAASIPSDGKLVVTADPEIAAGYYKTRMVVVRPINAALFNGTVIVEWLNVSAGGDTPPDWIMAHDEFTRQGYAWVGVSAQATGVNALKNGASTAARYASLLHPGDSYSYDIYTRAGLLAKEPAATLLGGLTAERVIAAGESQSAFRMVTYIDAVQPIEHVYDGFMVHSTFGSGAAISQAPLAQVNFPAPAPIRDDLDVPVMIVQAEGDVIGSNLTARQPANTSMIREWELAGTSHADAYTTGVGLSPSSASAGALTMFGYLSAPPNNYGCVNGINAGPHHWIVQAAFRGLDTWVRTLQDLNVADVAPPHGTPLTVISSSPVVLARDAYGNALGGVRSPHVDAPVATLDSVNSAAPGGFGFCSLFGRSIPFTFGQISALYTDKADFVTQWSASIDAQVANGFLLEVDGVDLKAAANTWQYPPPP
jgi:hypothetical protein